MANGGKHKKYSNTQIFYVARAVRRLLDVYRGHKKPFKFLLFNDKRIVV